MGLCPGMRKQQRNVFKMAQQHLVEMFELKVEKQFEKQYVLSNAFFCLIPTVIETFGNNLFIRVTRHSTLKNSSCYLRSQALLTQQECSVHKPRRVFCSVFF